MTNPHTINHARPDPPSSSCAWGQGRCHALARGRHGCHHRRCCARGHCHGRGGRAPPAPDPPSPQPLASALALPPSRALPMPYHFSGGTLLPFSYSATMLLSESGLLASRSRAPPPRSCRCCRMPSPWSPLNLPPPLPFTNLISVGCPKNLISYFS